MEASHESYFKAHDHHRLYYRSYPAKRPKGVLLFVHGLNEHSGRYSHPVKYFSERDYTLYLFDHRGHGKSDGLRSFVDNFDTYLKDLHHFTQMVAEAEKGKKLFMIGHSMGGQVVINYVEKYKNPLTGFLTSSANIETAVRIPWLKKKFCLALAQFAPRLSVTNEIDPKWISRDKEVVREYKKDPLVSKKITLKLAAEIIENQKGILKLADAIRLPALIMHAGDDHICKAEGSKKFFRKLASSDKALKIYDGFYHELFNEIGKEKVFADMDHWLEKHL